MSSTSEVRSREIRFLNLKYDHSISQESALSLILALFPHWESDKDHIELIRFTDGITNTLLKAVKRLPGLSEEEIDSDAVLLRAYGTGTDIIIDRERETQNHELLGQYRLAPRLLARFENGMLYRYIKGTVTTPADLRREQIWRGVARRLAEWHAVIPCLPASVQNGTTESIVSPKMDKELQRKIDQIAPGKPVPNVWSVMQRWLFALPVSTDEQKQRQANLQKELTKIVAEFSNRPGLGVNGVSVTYILRQSTANESIARFRTL